jgi:hypothetical protein
VKPVGHLRYAWVALVDAAGHVEELLGAELEKGEKAEIQAAALSLASSMEYLRPVLTRAELATYNNNGETPLEWAKEARATRTEAHLARLAPAARASSAGPTLKQWLNRPRAAALLDDLRERIAPGTTLDELVCGADLYVDHAKTLTAALRQECQNIAGAARSPKAATSLPKKRAPKKRASVENGGADRPIRRRK